MFPDYLNTFLSDVRFSALESGIHTRRSGLFLWSIAHRDKAGVGCAACCWDIAIPFSVFLTLSDLVVGNEEEVRKEGKSIIAISFLVIWHYSLDLALCLKLTLSYGCFCGLRE